MPGEIVPREDRAHRVLVGGLTESGTAVGTMQHNSFLSNPLWAVRSGDLGVVFNGPLDGCRFPARPELRRVTPDDVPLRARRGAVFHQRQEVGATLDDLDVATGNRL